MKQYYPGHLQCLLQFLKGLASSLVGLVVPGGLVWLVVAGTDRSNAAEVLKSIFVGGVALLVGLGAMLVVMIMFHRKFGRDNSVCAIYGLWFIAIVFVFAMMLVFPGAPR